MSSDGLRSAYASQAPPAHHVHHDSEPLPGANGAAPSANYSTTVTENDVMWQGKNEREFGPGSDTGAVVAGGQHEDPSTPGAQSGHNAFNEERPLDVEPTPQGGVAVNGQDDLPEGHAKFTDKLIGKTQKVTGKAMRNPEMHEKGELRESGGKAAVKGEARASHD